MAPYDRPGAVAELHSIDRLGYRLARSAPAAGRALFGAMFAACRRSPERALQGFRNDVSEPDQAAIDALPDAQRLVITLRDVAGFDGAEVCELLDLSEGNQRVLLHRARAKVRATLETYVEEDVA